MLSDFNYETHKGDILVFYFLNKSFPYIRKNATLHKFMNYSLDKNAYDEAIKNFPYMTE